MSCEFKVGDVLRNKSQHALCKKIRVTEVSKHYFVGEVLEGDDLETPIIVYRAGWGLYEKVETEAPTTPEGLQAKPVDDDTYAVFDKEGVQKMLLTRIPGGDWKLYRLVDHDQYRTDLMDRHGISFYEPKG